MQKINYNEKIKLNSLVNELLVINIDDKFEQSLDSDCIKISGIIQISGEAAVEKGNQSFNKEITVDILLSKEQLTEEKVTVSIDDFNYNIENDTIDINLIIRIDGLKEIEAFFPPQEDQTDIKIEEQNILERLENSNKMENNTLEDIFEQEVLENESTIPSEINQPQKKDFSLLSQIFKNRSIKKETAYNLHVIKTSTTYQEISTLYNVDIDKLKKINNDEELYIGKLIFIPNK